MRFQRPLPTTTALAALTLAACASQGPSTIHGTEIRLRYAQVTEIARVQMPSAMPAGAAVGGFTGLILGSGSSGSRQLAAGAAGAGLGALVARSLEGDRLGYRYTLAFNDGSMSRFITEKGYLQRGDCVVVEEGVYANIRRVASTLCTAPPSPATAEVLARNAEQCYAAKEELLAASTNEALDAAARKVQILCEF